MHPIDSANLRAFLDAPSRISGSNNSHLLSNIYNGNDPSTYPATWGATIDGYKRITVVNWRHSDLSGDLNLAGCQWLDTLIIGGQYQNHSNVNKLTLTDCASLKYLDCSYNKLWELNLFQSPYLSYLDCSYNFLTFRTVELATKPAMFHWESQAAVIPVELKHYGGNLYQLEIDSIDLTVYGSNILYEWYVEGENDPIWINPINGKFFLTDLDGKTVYCRMTSMQNMFYEFTLVTVMFRVDLSSSIRDSYIASTNIYPNPANDFATVSFDGIIANSSNMEINIFDITSRHLGNVYTGDFTDRITFSTNHLPVGIYYLQINIGNYQLVKLLNIQR